jgi:hypothetical protein
MAKPYRKQPDDRIRTDLTRAGQGEQIRDSLMEKDRVLSMLAGGSDSLVPSGGAAPVGEAFVTIGNTSGLSAERALTGTANQVIVTDNGADSSVVLSTPQDLDINASFQVGHLGVGVAPSLGLVHILDASGTATLVLSASLSIAGPTIIFRDTDTGNQKSLLANLITGTTALVLPDTSTASTDFLVARTSLDTLTRKTISTDGIFKTSSASTGASFSDTTTATKRLRIILSGAVGNNFFDIQTTAARGYTFPNYTGFVAVPPDEGTSGNVLTSTGAGSQPTYQTLSGAGIAPSNAQYVTLALSAGLSAERVLTGTSNQITITDGGANGNVTLSAPQNLHTSATFQVSTLGLGAVARTSPATLALDVTGRTAFVTVAQSFGTSQTNYDIGASTVLRLTATAAALAVRGFTNGVDGRIVFIINDGTTNAITLIHDAVATAANRFYIAGLQSCVINPGECKVAIYDGTISRWRVTDWMSPFGAYVVSGLWVWNAALTIDGDGSGSLVVSASLPTTPQVTFSDAGTGNTIVLRTPVMAGTRNVDIADFTGLLPIAGSTVVAAAGTVAAGSLGKHDSTGNTATVGATTLGNTLTAGMYRLSWYVKVTTAGDVVVTDNLTITCAWNDGGAQTATLSAEDETTLLNVLPVDTLNRAFSGSKRMYAAAGTNISITATLVNGGATNPAYTFRARLEAIA